MNVFEYQFKTMGGPARFKFYAETENRAQEIYTLVLQELERLDKTYSNYSATSYVADINRSAGHKDGITVDDETAGLLDYADRCYHMSDGLFDITSGILHKIWDFHAKHPRIPSQKEIDQILTCVGWDKVEWKRPHLKLPIEGMVLDFGGIVKEYAVDSIVKLCHQHQIFHGLIELGGDIGVLGPHMDGRSWNIGITHPSDSSNCFALVPLAQGAIATSGDYERNIKINDTVYPHILNPITGYPVQGVHSVTVISEHCLIAGSLTTIGFLKGDQGKDWLLDLHVPFMVIDRDLQVTSTIECAPDKIDRNALHIYENKSPVGENYEMSV